MNLQEIKEKLLKEREELNLLLEASHKERIESLKEYTSTPDEMADKYETKQEMHIEEESLKARLIKINKALEKIEKGTYGICEKCQNKIEDIRLKIDLATEFCRKCST